jgi:hypothetical protein
VSFRPPEARPGHPDREAVYTVLPFFSFFFFGIPGTHFSMHPVSFGGAFACLVLSQSAAADTLAQLAKQQGCTSPPVVVDGTDLFKCQTQGAMSYFSGPPPEKPTAPAARKSGAAGGGAPRTASPANFPRVDSGTQRERDDVRKRVLTEELATENRMLSESQALLAQGSAPQAGETTTSPRYLDRVAKLKQAVDNHVKNIAALNKELERVR